MNSQARIQELQNEIKCVNDWRDFQDAESVRSGLSHVPSQPAIFSTFARPSWNAKPFSGNAEPEQWAAKYWGHTWYIGKRFWKSNGVLFSTLSAGIESMEFSFVGTNFTHQRRRRKRIKHQFKIRDASQDRQPEIQSSLLREYFQRIMVQTNNDCRFQILISRNSTRQQRSLVGR